MFTGPMPVDLTAVSRASSARRRAPDQRALRSDVPGAPETYGSIAAAFDFEHHEHTDPAAELVALKAILAREALLSQLEVLSEDLVRRAHRAWALREVPPPLDAPTRRAAVDLMCRLRRATLDVCEAIGAWREISDAPELAFVWHGRDYALKMARSDMDFVKAARAGTILSRASSLELDAVYTTGRVHRAARGGVGRRGAAHAAEPVDAPAYRRPEREL